MEFANTLGRCLRIGISSRSRPRAGKYAPAADGQAPDDNEGDRPRIGSKPHSLCKHKKGRGKPGGPTGPDKRWRGEHRHRRDARRLSRAPLDLGRGQGLDQPSGMIRGVIQTREGLAASHRGAPDRKEHSEKGLDFAFASACASAEEEAIASASPSAACDRT